MLNKASNSQLYSQKAPSYSEEPWNGALTAGTVMVIVTAVIVLHGAHSSSLTHSLHSAFSPSLSDNIYKIAKFLTGSLVIASLGYLLWKTTRWCIEKLNLTPDQKLDLLLMNSAQLFHTLAANRIIKKEIFNTLLLHEKKQQDIELHLIRHKCA